MVNATPRPPYPQGKDQISIVQEADWAPGRVRTRVENLTRTEILSQTVQPVASPGAGTTTGGEM